MNTELWYKSSAKTFSEALPVGNGSLGAVIYGGVPQENILLNLDTFWSGSKRKKEKAIPEELLAQVKSLVFEKQYGKAQKLIEENLLGGYNESYMPVGSLCYMFENIDQGNVTEYRRSLDLTQAVAATSFRNKNNRISSELFISYPDHLLVSKISAEDQSALDLTVWLDSLLPHQVEIIHGNTILLSETAPTHVEPNYIKSSEPIIYEKNQFGMRCICQVRVETEGGKLTARKGGISISGATTVYFYLTIVDGYRGYFKELENEEEVMREKCDSILNICRKYNYEDIKQRHLEDYRQLFGRVSFQLNDNHDDSSTSDRLRNLKEGREDRGLYCLYFQYSRYLMIASSRKGTQPANLQGIWSDSIRPVWSSNWTININTEMNYWMIGSCNLLECHEPLMRMVGELSAAGEETARNQYYCRGWAANHNVDLWRQTAAVGGLAKYAYWPMGGVWLSIQIYDYYRYTKDFSFLKQEAFPVMTGAARFCADWLMAGEDGFYHTAPSTSPENTFLDKEGNECGVSYSSTMDISLIRELFQNVMEAYEILGLKDDLYIEIKKKAAKLPPYKVGEDGRLLEWVEEYKEKDAGHRHFSPLVGFHPGRTINKRDSKELVAACKKFIEYKINNGGGHIGWSCAWLVNFYARLENGEMAYFYLRHLLQHSTYDNLFDLHPPLGENDGEKEVFQIDGNFGSAAGVAAMFLQSYLDKIELLPALPAEWTEGSMEGLLAENGFVVSVYWSNGILTKADITSLLGEKARIKYKAPIAVKEEEMLEVNNLSPDEIEFPTSKGHKYTIIPKEDC